jgi:tetratricopeptide (TPR) repeat protein
MRRPPPSGRRLPSWLPPLIVALATFAAFAPALRAAFVTWDDDRNFTDNPYYRGLEWRNLRWMWTTFHMGHYHPLSWMSLGLDYLLWGMNPAGYHAVNLLLHSANAVLFYFIARRLLARASAGTDETTVRLGAAFAAVIFAVHPLRVESVVWITERRDVLSGAFYLGSLLLYLRSRDDDRAHPTRDYCLAVAMFVLALLSKATAVTLPAALLILNIYPLRRLGAEQGWVTTAAQRVYLEIVPFGLLAVGTSLLSIVALHPGHQLSFAAKLAVSAYSLRFYLWNSLAPSGLAPLYEMPKKVDPLAARYLVGYACVIGLSVVAWLARRRWPAVTTGWIAYLVISLPLLGVVQNGPQIAADRYTYQAALAIGAVAGAGLLVAMSRAGRTAAWGAAAIVGVYGALTWRQTLVWHDSQSLWERVLEIDPQSSIAQTAIANVYHKQGRFAEAIDHYRTAIALDPESMEVQNNLGVALAHEGKYAEAITYYERAVAHKRDYYEAHNNWGAALAQLGDLAGAIDQYRQALAIKPDYADAEVNWGNALVRLNKPEEAIPHYEAALRVRPDQAEAEHNWGVALARQGKYAEAIEHFRAALAINPNHAEAKDYLERAMRLLSAPR